MTHLTIDPGKLNGHLTVPPSKSLAHRAIICAALAEGNSRLYNIQYSDDIKATIEGMRAFGAEINEEKSSLSITGVGLNAGNSGNERSVQKNNSEDSQTIDCNESGSTLRFLVPVATLFDGQTRFTGRGKLGQRPLKPFEDLFLSQGLRYESSGNRMLDLTTEGALEPGVFELRGDISSQFITGLLMTLPFLKEDSIIIVTTPLESKGYIDLTLAVFKAFGITVHVDEDSQRFTVPGNQMIKGVDYTVEGDYSQAAFFLSANHLGNTITLDGLNSESLQGDKAILSILGKLNNSSTRVIDGSQCPDIIPVAALAAALSEGTTRFENLERLRIKESDRLEATQKELTKLGADIKVDGDALLIQGVKELDGGVTVWSYKDHRMAMMLAVASTRCKNPVIIEDTECVAKSYPHFWKEFKKLGGKIHERYLG